MFLVTVWNTAFRSILSSGDILIVVSVSRFASADLSVSIIIWNKCCTASILGCSAPALFQISYLQINCSVKLCLLVSFSTKFVIYAQTNKWKWQRDLRIYVALRTFLSNCKSRNGVVICECFLLYRRVVETTTDATKAHRWKKAYQSTTETFSLMSICKAYLISRLLLCGPVWIMAPACITFLWFKKKEVRESLRRCPERQNTAWSDSEFQAHVSSKRRLLRELHKVLSEWIPVMMFQGNVGEQIFHHIIRKKFYGVLFSEGCVQPWKNSRSGDMSLEAATFTKVLAPSCFNLIFFKDIISAFPFGKRCFLSLY